MPVLTPGNDTNIMLTKFISQILCSRNYNNYYTQGEQVWLHKYLLLLLLTTTDEGSMKLLLIIAVIQKVADKS